MKNVSIPYRDFKNIVLPELQRDTIEIDWSEIYYMNTVDEQLTFFNYHISKLYDKHVPIKYRSIKKIDDDAWFRRNIFLQRLIIDRNLAYMRWKNDRSSSNWEKYVGLRNKVTSSRRRARINMTYKKYDSALPYKKLWNNLRNDGVVPSDDVNYSAYSPDEFNKFFASTQTSQSMQNSQSLLNSHLYTNHFSEFTFSNITSNDVIDAFKLVKSSSVGTDNISFKFGKLLLPTVLPYFTFILNTSLTKSTYPTAWKHSKIIPIPKQTGTNLISDFRPVSILSSLSKVLEYIMKSK